MFLRQTRPRQFAKNILHSHLRLFHRAPIISPTSDAATDRPPSPFSLKLITPHSKAPLVHDFDDAWGLDAFVRCYGGSLRGPIPNRLKVISYSKYNSLSPDSTYEIFSPYFEAVEEQRHHNQIADKSFESKARLALIRYLGETGMKYHEIARVIKNGNDVVAEWEGIFEIDGGVWFLECKNTINEVNITLSDLC